MRAVMLLGVIACRFEPGAFATTMGDASDPDTAFDTSAATGLVARWRFDEITGATVHDTESPALDLTIENTGSVRWLGDALAVDQSVRIWSSVPAPKLTSLGSSTGFTIEAWVKPNDRMQNGPARIVSVSRDGLEASFVLGQEYATWVFRVRTTQSSPTGMPNLATPDVIATTPSLSHVVAKYDNGTRVLYVDGVEAQRDQLSGAPLFDASHQPALANEPNADAFGLRPWLGELHHVAIWERALAGEEIAALFVQGI